MSPLSGERSSLASSSGWRGAGQRDQRVGLDRPAGEHATARSGRSTQPSSGSPSCSGARPVEHHAERALVVVLEHVDHGAVEVGVLQRRRRDEQAPLRRCAPGDHRSSLPARGESAATAARPVSAELHDHASYRMIMRMTVRVGIIGASGYTGRRAAAAARRPSRRSTSCCATGDTQAGDAGGDAVPGLAARLPAISSFEASRPRRVVGHGLDVVFLGLPHEASMALAPELVGTVGCVVDLSAAFRLKDAARVPALVRLRARPAGAARRGRVRAARAAPRRAARRPARSPPPAATSPPRRWRSRPLLDAGVIEPRRRDRRRRQRRHRRRARAQADDQLLHRRRELRRLRAARPPAHARDRAGDRRRGAVHAPPRADEPGHPRHLLRPPGRPGAVSTDVAARRPRQGATPTSRSSSSPTVRRRRRRRSARTPPTSRRATTSAPGTSSRSARSTT